jgi:hypothetical protein
VGSADKLLKAMMKLAIKPVTKPGKDFNEYCRDLDSRFLASCKNPPLTQESWIIRQNVRGYDLVFLSRTNHCSAPGCGYPIKDADNFYITSVGSVCDLCWAMYMAVKMKLWFLDAQAEADKKKKKGFGI